MLDEGLIGTLVVAEAIAYRRAVFGRPPRRPIRVFTSGVTASTIHISFHALATVAPTVLSAITFVLAGWTTFLIWWKWMARAPKPKWGEGDDAGGGPGGGGGSGPSGKDPSPTDGGGDGVEFDWERFERDLEDYADRDRQLAGV